MYNKKTLIVEQHKESDQHPHESAGWVFASLAGGERGREERIRLEDLFRSPTRPAGIGGGVRNSRARVLRVARVARVAIHTNAQLIERAKKDNSGRPYYDMVDAQGCRRRITLV